MLTIKKIAAAAAFALATALTAAAPATAAPQENAPPAATADAELDKDGVLFIQYRGEIVRDMAGYIERMFDKYKDKSYKVVLQIDSVGGEVEAGERVILVLNRIKTTHRLLTVVMPGRTCASMCVPIYLQGHERHAARSSLWLFHEAAKQVDGGKVRIDRQETIRLFQRYFVPAGVSVDWLNAILPTIRQSDLWQTGQDLIGSNTGIVMYPIENKRARNVEAEPAKTTTSSQAPAGQRPQG